MKINKFILSFLVFGVLFSGCGYSALEVGTNMQKAREAAQKGEVDRKDFFTFTPLSHASQYRNLDIVKYLIEKGADVSIKTNKGKTALDIASKYKRDKTIAFLKELNNPSVKKEKERIAKENMNTTTNVYNTTNATQAGQTQTGSTNYGQGS